MERYDVDFRLAKETALGEPIGANEDGATAIEYGLIAALISLACFIAFTSRGMNWVEILNMISNTLSRW